MYFVGDICFKNSTTFPIFNYCRNILREPPPPPFPLCFFAVPPFKAFFSDLKKRNHSPIFKKQSQCFKSETAWQVPIFDKGGILGQMGHNAISDANARTGIDTKRFFISMKRPCTFDNLTTESML